MKRIILIAFVSVLISCNSKQNKETKDIDKSKNSDSLVIKTDLKEKVDSQVIKSTSGETEAMLEKDIKFNGTLKRYFSLTDFDKAFGKPDSIKDITEDACSYIFEDAEDKYLFKDGSKFENSKEKVAVAEFKFINKKGILDVSLFYLLPLLYSKDFFPQFTQLSSFVFGLFPITRVSRKCIPCWCNTIFPRVDTPFF